MNAQILKPDICVIGAGAAGRSLAAAAATAGAAVVLVGNDAAHGLHARHPGVSVRALCTAAAQVHAINRGSHFGVAAGSAEIDFRKMLRHVRNATAAVAPDTGDERLGALGVRILAAHARFKDRHTVQAGDFEVKARHFVLATGGVPEMPPIMGLDEAGCLTWETIYDLPRRPAKVLITGAGHGVLELAQAFGRLGSQVVIIGTPGQLASQDPEAVSILLRTLRAEGVDIREDTTATRIERKGRSGVRLHISGEADGEEAIDGTHLLVLPARKPAIVELDLKRAGIRTDQGGITISDRMRTTNRKVYAIGDVTGAQQSIHAAARQAEIVLDAILGKGTARADQLLIPRVVGTEPALASVGLTETEARRRHRSIRVLRSAYAGNDRAQAEGRSAGFVKLVCDERGLMLGVAMVGAEANELIGVWALAIARGLTAEDMSSYLPPYPSFGEIGKQAASAYFAGKRRASIMQRLTGRLRGSG
ncbi:MAG: NAD(P)/FAD-dependent oxidoreductase [Aquamicrobium sp.]|nr:NAD(P)/FAD-dependent oxidoreductase [Aquamicrobium sp.]